MNEPSSFEQYSGSLGRFASSQNLHLTQELLQEFLVILHLILHCSFSAFVLSTLHACLHVFRVVSHFSSHSFLAGKSCRHGAIGGIGGGGGGGEGFGEDGEGGGGIGGGAGGGVLGGGIGGGEGGGGDGGGSDGGGDDGGTSDTSSSDVDGGFPPEAARPRRLGW